MKDILVNSTMKRLLLMLKNNHFDILRVGVATSGVGVRVPDVHKLQPNMIFDLKSDVDLIIEDAFFSMRIVIDNNVFACHFPYMSCTLMQGKQLKDSKEVELFHFMNFGVIEGVNKPMADFSDPKEGQAVLDKYGINPKVSQFPKDRWITKVQDEGPRPV